MNTRGRVIDCLARRRRPGGRPVGSAVARRAGPIPVSAPRTCRRRFPDLRRCASRHWRCARAWRSAPPPCRRPLIASNITTCSACTVSRCSSGRASARLRARLMVNSIGVRIASITASKNSLPAARATARWNSRSALMPTTPSAIAFSILLSALCMATSMSGRPVQRGVIGRVALDAHAELVALLDLGHAVDRAEADRGPGSAAGRVVRFCT